MELSELNKFGEIAAIKIIDVSFNERYVYEISIFYFDKDNNLKEYGSVFFYNTLEEIFNYFINNLGLCILNNCDIKELFGKVVCLNSHFLFVKHKYFTKIKLKEKVITGEIVLNNINLATFLLNNHIKTIEEKLNIPEEQYVYFKLILSKKKNLEDLAEGPLCEKEIEYFKRYLPDDLILLTEI